MVSKFLGEDGSIPMGSPLIEEFYMISSVASSSNSYSLSSEGCLDYKAATFKVAKSVKSEISASISDVFSLLLPKNTSLTTTNDWVSISLIPDKLNESLTAKCCGSGSMNANSNNVIESLL